ncbi:hypothetical protein [Paenibacillus naphthalenovorans]|uniref:hypothetical protein n=1 Tax=Paenibacillus naphthalenovorans TaxID=162209 RepID=UPI003D2DB9B6
MNYSATLERFNQAINRMESAIMDAVEAYRLQLEVIRQMAERGVTPETIGGEIERLTAEIERDIS